MNMRFNKLIQFVGARRALPLLLTLLLSFLLFSLPAFSQETPPPAETEEDDPTPPTEEKETPPPANDTPEDFTIEKYGEPETTTTGGEDNTSPTANSDELIYLSGTDMDLKQVIKKISKATGISFLINESQITGKITIISEQPMTKDVAYQAFLSALQVNGYTTVQAPGGFVRIIPTKDQGAIREPLEIYKDGSPNTEQYITRIVQVVNISANELSSVVKNLVSKGGNLFAYPATNSLILTDTGSNIDRILKIIRELDKEGPQEEIRIIPLQYADAKDIAEKVSSLFANEIEGGSSGRTISSRRNTSKEGATTELQETPSISKVIADERLNAIIVLGTKRSIIKVKALISQLDSPIAGVEGSIHVYYLKHANATELAAVLSSLVSGTSSKTSTTGTTSRTTGRNTTTTGQQSATQQRTTAQNTAAKVGSVELEGGVKVTADEGTNALVITASPKDYQLLVDQVIMKLDIQRRQVYLEAVIMEMSVSKTKVLGFGGNLGGVFNLLGSGFTAFGGILPLTTTALASAAGAEGGMVGGAFSTNNVDLSVSDGAGGTTTVSIPAVSLLLQALQTDSDVNVLSTPSILTLDNQEAKIQVGQEVPTPAGSTVASGLTSFSVTREDVGIILTVTPQVNEESETVRLDISQEITNVIPSSADSSLGPTLTKRTVDTVVVANDKQTIVIGGLIDDKNTVGTAKVPGIGDVPVLGSLFRTKTTAKEKTNIIVFITPYIIRDRSDYAEILKKKIEERNLFIELNYGATQRKQIRESIKNHAEQLLEYKETTDAPLTSPTSSSSTTTTSPTSTSSTPSTTSMTQQSTDTTTSTTNSTTESSTTTTSSSKKSKSKSSTTSSQKTKAEDQMMQDLQSITKSTSEMDDSDYGSPAKKVKTKYK